MGTLVYISHIFKDTFPLAWLSGQALLSGKNKTRKVSHCVSPSFAKVKIMNVSDYNSPICFLSSFAYKFLSHNYNKIKMFLDVCSLL